MVVIDGGTSTVPLQVVVLDESADLNEDAGLTILAGGGGSTIRGLVIRGFKGRGIYINDSSQNTIGGETSNVACTIYGNRKSGIYITGEHSTFTRIVGCLIGTDAVAAKGNGENGVTVAGAATFTTIGTAMGSPTFPAWNVISGNTGPGTRPPSVHG